jgi:hypothetical protein
MIDLAISVDTDARGTTVIETNRGSKLKAPRWPQDCETQLVAFNPSGKTCKVIWTEQLADDIGRAIRSLHDAGVLKGRKPDWYRRLAHCAEST